MNVAAAREIVVQHQRWRRGLDEAALHSPTEVGQAIDTLLLATADDAAAQAVVDSRHRTPPHCDTCDCLGEHAAG